MHLSEAINIIDGVRPSTEEERRHAWSYLHRTKAIIMLPGDYARRHRELVLGGAFEEDA